MTVEYSSFLLESSLLPDFFHLEVTVKLCPFLYLLNYNEERLVGRGGVGVAKHQ